MAERLDARLYPLICSSHDSPPSTDIGRAPCWGHRCRAEPGERVPLRVVGIRPCPHRRDAEVPTPGSSSVR